MVVNYSADRYTVSMNRFIEGLTRHQGAETGAAFAQRIGVSPQFWSDLRRGRRSLPRALAGRLIALWPDLEEAYMDDVRDDLRARRQAATTFQIGDAASAERFNDAITVSTRRQAAGETPQVT